MGNDYGIDSKKDFRSANVNVIFYDKGIISNFETHLNFLSVKKIVKGAIFGTDDSKLFFRVLDLIKNAESPPFVLIISGSLAEEVLPKIHDEKFIYDVLIFCFNKSKYSQLQKKFPKIKLVESMDFENIIKFLKSKNYTLAQNKKGAKFLKNEPLITFSEYENYYYQFHHIIAQNFCKNSLKLEESDKSNFLHYVTSKKNEAKNILKQLRNDKNFYSKIINIYTKESPICYVLNKELRRLNPANYYYIKNYACSTLYSLYKFYNKNKKTGKVENVLYRALNLKLADMLLYKVCEGDIICYPGFTSACTSAITSDKFVNIASIKDEDKKSKKSQEQEDLLLAKKMQDEDERLPSPLGQEIAYEGENIVDCVDIIIENNNKECEYPSAINISSVSDKKAEEERLFPAFSFFKIKKVEILDGSAENPHHIYLEVVNKKYNLEERMFRGERVYLDSQTNLLMTRKFINE